MFTTHLLRARTHSQTLPSADASAQALAEAGPSRRPSGAGTEGAPASLLSADAATSLTGPSGTSPSAGSRLVARITTAIVGRRSRANSCPVRPPTEEQDAPTTVSRSPSLPAQSWTADQRISQRLSRQISIPSLSLPEVSAIPPAVSVAPLRPPSPSVQLGLPQARWAMAWQMGLLSYMSGYAGTMDTEYCAWLLRLEGLGNRADDLCQLSSASGERYLVTPPITFFGAKAPSALRLGYGATGGLCAFYQVQTYAAVGRSTAGHGAARPLVAAPHFIESLVLAEIVARTEVRDLIAVGPSLFAAVRYYEGHDITRLLHLEPGLRGALACRVVLALAKTLRRLTKNSCVHHRISAEHIVWSRDGIALAGFRGAKLTGADGRRTDDMAQVLMPPPELMEGFGSYDHCLDVWGVGAVCMQILAPDQPLLPRAPTSAATMAQLHGYVAWWPNRHKALAREDLCAPLQALRLDAALAAARSVHGPLADWLMAQLLDPNPGNRLSGDALVAAAAQFARAVPEAPNRFLDAAMDAILKADRDDTTSPTWRLGQVVRPWRASFSGGGLPA